MNLLRRQLLQLAVGAVAAPAVARRAFADAYPSRPVRLISGFAPAGGNDIIARLIGQWLTERLGQTFVIENRPGAGTNIAAELVIKSPPDGYTLFVTNLSNAINVFLYERLNFDFTRDMLPVAGIARPRRRLQSTPPFRPERSPSSSPTPRPIQAGSTWGRPGSAAPAISPANCSS